MYKLSSKYLYVYVYTETIIYFEKSEVDTFAIINL